MIASLPSQLRSRALSALGGFAALSLLLAASLLAAFATSPAGAQTNAGDLDRAVKALRAVTTMRADFSQTDRQGQVMRGVLTLKRPGRIRFDYGQDADLLVVANGKSLYMVDYEVRQVERWPIKNSPLGALFDPDRDVKQFGRLIPTGSQDVISIEVRDPDKPEFGTINLIFVRKPSAPGGLELTHWVAQDAQNHRTTVRLANHRYNVSVADSTFKFRDPRRSPRR